MLGSDYKEPKVLIREEQPQIKVIGTLDIAGYDHGKRVHDPEGISPTLTAVAGGTHHIKIFDRRIIKVRKLTPTEYGRLQGFPVDDGWEQVVSDSQAYKQFGNAVTKTVVEAIGRNIIVFLDKRKGQEQGERQPFIPEQITDLSGAPKKIKEQILTNAERLKARDKQEPTPVPKTSGLKAFSNEELLAEINRRMTAHKEAQE